MGNTEIPLNKNPKSDKGGDDRTQAKIRSHKKLNLVLFVLLVAGFTYIFFGQTDLFKGSVLSCKNMPEEEKTGLVALTEDVQSLFAEVTPGLALQKEIVALHKSINTSLGKANLTASRDCKDGIAYVDEVLGLPDAYGLCVLDEEDLPAIVALMKDSDQRVAIKDQIVAFAGKNQELASLSGEEQERVKKAKALMVRLDYFQEVGEKENYCELAELNFEDMLAQASEYVL